MISQVSNSYFYRVHTERSMREATFLKSPQLNIPIKDSVGLYVTIYM